METYACVDGALKALWHLVGNTPMIEITYLYKGELRKIYAKCEHYNLTGSIKDRMALYILQKAYEFDLINPGDVIVEATSGNTGISFSAIGKALGHEIKILMPDWLSKERSEIIRSLGAEVILISKKMGGFRGCIDLTREMAEVDDRVFLPNQFENAFNVEAHEKTTGKEIWQQLQSVNLKPDAFVAGVGTGGTVMGVGRYLRKHDSGIRIHPVEPAESPALSTGYKVGSHRIQGISDEFIPPILKLDWLNEIVRVSDGDSILMAQKLARQLGLAVGISSGANFLAAAQLQNNSSKAPVIATVFCDSNKKYLSTDLVREEPAKENYYSPDVQLLEYRAIKCW